jgi:plasmanylethanolamine desaturase
MPPASKPARRSPASGGDPAPDLRPVEARRGRVGKVKGIQAADSATAPSFRALEVSAMALFIVLTALLTLRLGPGLRERWAAALLAMALGVLSMDFLSGFLHWAGDTWGSVHWPWIGPHVLRTFREHHVDAEAITRHDAVEVNATNAMIALPALSIGHWLGPDSYLGSAYMLAIGLSAIVTNQIHLWAHRRENPRWIRRLQRLGLILSPEAHALHHEPPFHDHYCITTGWLNQPLARIRFFRGAEWLVTRVTGAMPRAEDAVAAEALDSISAAKGAPLEGESFGLGTAEDP